MPRGLFIAALAGPHERRGVFPLGLPLLGRLVCSGHRSLAIMLLVAHLVGMRGRHLTHSEPSPC